MAPPTYSASKHHIGLSDGGTTYGFMVEGGFRRSMQRESLGVADYGGQTDLIGRMPSISRWTQDAFEGGMGQWMWGRDEAMFAECKGFMSTPSDRSIQTVPPMHRKKAINPAAQANAPSQPIKPRGMFMVGGKIFTVFQHDVNSYAIDTDTSAFAQSTWTTFDGDGTQTIIRGVFDPTDNSIWLLTKDTSSGVLPTFYRLTTSLADETVVELAAPAGTAGRQPYNFSMLDGNILVQIARKFYYGKVPDDPDSGNTISWTKVGRIPGRWVADTTYNGVLYILTNDAPSSPSFGSTIYAWDGTSLLPIVRLPFNFYGKCIVDYAGRIFVGGTGTDINGGEHYAELYEITGGSVRLVKSFSPWARRKDIVLGNGDWPKSIEDLVVFEGQLWWFAKGEGLYAYDITSDGVFGASKLSESQDNLVGYSAVTGRGRMWWWCYDGDNPTTKTGIYRVGQPADYSTSVTSEWTSSDFAPEFGVKKGWGQYKVLSKYAVPTKLEYSLNGGSSWTDLGAADSTDSLGYRFIATWDLSGVTNSQMIRFRLTFTVTDYTYFQELLATTLSFSMGDEGKRAWRFSVIKAVEIETLDAELDEGVTQAYDISDTASQLWSWAAANTALTFTDVDGATYNVRMQGIDEVHPVLGPEPSGESQPESLITLSLVEV